VFALAFNPSGTRLAAAGGDGSIWIWGLDRAGVPQLRTMLHGANPGGGTYAVAFSPDGSTLAAAGSAGDVTFFGANGDVAAAAVCTSGGDQLTRAEWTQYVPGSPYRDLCP
jgi:WD40 repeat protein